MQIRSPKSKVRAKPSRAKKDGISKGETRQSEVTINLTMPMDIFQAFVASFTKTQQKQIADFFGGFGGNGFIYSEDGPLFSWLRPK